MSNWKLINQTYLYDGTFDGFLTIVFRCYETKTLPQKIYAQQKYESNFLDKIEYIASDYKKSERVFLGIQKIIGYDTLYNSFYAFLSDDKDKEMHLLKYICEGFDIGPKINTMLTIPYVFNVISMKRRTLFESHRFKGLLRFQEIKEDFLYASFHPDHNIIEPLGQHFMRRLPTQNFIIEDKNRNLCFLYHGDSYEIVDSQELEIPAISETERKYQELWKVFFKTIAISERKNSLCQMQFMPKKYWKDLIEEP